MVHTDIQSLYDAHVASLPEGERLRLVELITRSLAVPSVSALAAAAGVETPPVAELRAMPGWHPAERRSEMSEWRDRAL